jgi:hypothetical protein
MNLPSIRVIHNPRPNQDVVETKRLNDFSAYFRGTDTYRKFCFQEGFELNYGNFEWEYIIKSKNNHSFIVLTERLDNGLLGVYGYFQGNEMKNKPDFYFNPTLSNKDITEHLVRLFEAFMKIDFQEDRKVSKPNQPLSKVPNYNQPVSKRSNYTPPKKKRK